jgi:hypothetical protein
MIAHLRSSDLKISIELGEVIGAWLMKLGSGVRDKVDLLRRGLSKGPFPESSSKATRQFALVKTR